MGEAIRKLRTAGQLVAFDLDAPRLTIAASDRHAFAVHPGSAGCVACDPAAGRHGICAAHYAPALAQARCVRALIGEVVRAAFGGQMGRSDGKIYAAWLEALDEIDEGTTTFDLPLEQVRWLARLIVRDDVKLAPGLAQWREAVVTYLDEIVAVGEEMALMAAPNTLGPSTPRE